MQFFVREASDIVCSKIQIDAHLFNLQKGNMQGNIALRNNNYNKSISS